MSDNSNDNSVVAELPGTNSTVMFDPDAKALYIKLKADIPGRLETHTLIANPLVNVDLYMGEAVGIEIILGNREEPPGE